MAKPKPPKVFDITGPRQVNPSATSKPVIVGHHPMMSDPMVRSHEHPPSPQSKESGPQDQRWPAEPLAEPRAPEPEEVPVPPPADQSPSVAEPVGPSADQATELAGSPDTLPAEPVTLADLPPEEKVTAAVATHPELSHLVHELPIAHRPVAYKKIWSIILWGLAVIAAAALGVFLAATFGS